MVTYQRWTSIAFEVARQQGMETTRSNSQDLVSILADVWNDRKEELSAATVQEARSIAQSEISV